VLMMGGRERWVRAGGRVVGGNVFRQLCGRG